MTEEGKTLEEIADEFDIELVQVPVGEIVPDPENANEMDGAMYDALVREIRDYGFVQPVLLRRMEDDSFKLIDGEHRWRAVKEIGVGKIPAVVIEADDEDAAMRLITMNRFKGEFVPVRLAHLIADLAKRVPRGELRERLGMDEGELRDNLRLANVKDGLSEKMVEVKGSKMRVLRFTLSKRDAKAVERVVDALSGETMDRGEALVHICREFERELS